MSMEVYHPLVFLMVYASLVVLALLIIVATRGRLSYERYMHEAELPTPELTRTL